MNKISEKTIPVQAQSQDSLIEQLAALLPWADRLGLYDAADYISGVVADVRKREIERSQAVAPWPPSQDVLPDWSDSRIR